MVENLGSEGRDTCQSCSLLLERHPAEGDRCVPRRSAFPAVGMSGRGCVERG